jgi:hypothetical protein
MGDEGESRRRKPRSFGKTLSRFGRNMLSYSVVALKYGVVPGTIFFAMNYTEPFPSLLELIVPAFAVLNF